ncbi:MAG TPA: hypothetical protein VF813_01530, partial [Anaerolineaceae bacterium]
VQRGGNPSASDRILASRLGAAATERIDRGEFGVLVGLNRGEITSTPLEEVIVKKKPIDPILLELADTLT